CGLSDAESTRMMQDDLAARFASQLKVSQTPQSNLQSARDSIASKYAASSQSLSNLPPPPRIYDRYSNSGRTVKFRNTRVPSKDQPNIETAIRLLTDWNIDTRQLWPSEITMFLESWPEEQAQLIQIWVSIPKYQLGTATKIDGLDPMDYQEGPYGVSSS
ncbi:hypothetical protein KEM55_001700, partial [Ascosphaera atra]